MEARKDISDMSFEEFFSESKVKQEKDVEKASEKAASKKKDKKQSAPKESAAPVGFQGSGPKMNFTAGRFQIYVPRYTAGENSRFEVAVEIGDQVVPLGRLESVKQRDTRVSRPSTLDLTTAGVLPFEGFTMTIDGQPVYEFKPRRMLVFNNIGQMLGKAVGEVFAVRDPSVGIRVSKAEIIDESKKNGLLITHMEVSIAGGVWIDESDGEAPEEPEEKPAEAPKQEPVKKEPAKKKAPAKKAKGALTVPQGLQDADVEFGGSVLPLYRAAPEVTAVVEGCEFSDCTLSVLRSGEAVWGPAELAFQNVLPEDLWGPLDIVLSKGGKSLDSRSVFVIPGFSCTYSGKGDITDDTSISYSVFGQEGSCDAFDEDSDVALTHEGLEFRMRWAVPAVTYDVGSGPVRLGDGEINVSDIKDGRMVLRAKGARKKAVFFGGETGKKREIPIEWDGDSAEVDMSEMIEEILSNPNATYCLYITVNSFPNRRFLTIRNPERIAASFSEGKIHVQIDPSVSECICRLYLMDRSVRDVQLSAGANDVEVDPQAIEAEVMEISDGKARITIPVQVRSLPFVVKDEVESLWLYVSKSKRIPLPDNLFLDGKPDEKVIKAWYDRIVRMNPELKNMPLQSVIQAFRDFAA